MILVATDGPVIDYGAIKAVFDDVAQAFDIRSVGYDRWGAEEMRQWIEGGGLEANPISQQIGPLSAGTKAVLRMVKAGRLRHGGNPILRMNANNAVGMTDSNENVKPDKKKSNGRIDGIVALVMAVDGAIRTEELDVESMVTAV